MKNMSTTVRSNNNSNLSSLSSPAHMDFPSRAEKIVVCSALLFEALFIFTENLVAIVFFALERELRKRKSLFLVINLHGVRGCNVRRSIRSFVCLFKGRFSAMEYHTRGWGSVGLLLPSLRYHFLAGFVNFRSFYIYLVKDFTPSIGH